MNLEHHFTSGTSNPEDLYNIQHAMSGSAEDYINDPSIETAWAIKCYENARTHMSLICSCDPTLLKLSPFDDEIYETFRRWFPKLNVELIEEDELKSSEAKEKWRQFVELFKEKIDHYNEGFLVRLNCLGNYDSDNTILVVKTQFLAIEIARNRKGCNSNLRNLYKADDMPPE